MTQSLAMIYFFSNASNISHNTEINSIQMVISTFNWSKAEIQMRTSK